MHLCKTLSLKATNRACCRCNGDGICRSCSCVKGRKTCVSCLPSRRGRCLNISHSSAPATQPVYCPSTHTQLTATDHACPSMGAGLIPATPTSATTIATFSNLASPAPTSLSASGRILSDAHHLPPPSTLADTNFVWGEYNSSTYSASLSLTYSEVVHWRRNNFKVPHGRGCKQFFF